MARGTRAVWILGCAVILLSGCSAPLARGPVSDFFAKDYTLPDYDARTAALGRRRRDVLPTPASAATGGAMGAVVGGHLRTWSVSASGAAGGSIGAAVGRTFSATERDDPLPEDYETLTLALPIVATDPNQGVTVGVLPVIILQEQERITNIFAPDITFNELQGAGPKFRMRRYFSRDATLFVDAGSTTAGAHDYDVIYTQRRFGPDEQLFFGARLFYRTDLSPRFYGLGNDSDVDQESNYVLRRTTATTSLGVALPLDLEVEFQERLTTYSIGPGRISNLPSTRATFPDVPGVRDPRTTILTHLVRLTYDSRDSRTAPTEGVLARAFVEFGDPNLGDVRFQRYGGSLTVLLPLFDKQLTTVLRVAAWIVEGRRVPFYEQTSLGGKSTIRGFGDGRFYDRNGYVANIEERWNVADVDLFGYRLVLQLAGFLDVGRVYADTNDFTLEDLQVAAGGAVRAIVPDSELVTSIDVGISDEGSAVFVGLDYPF